MSKEEKEILEQIGETYDVLLEKYEDETLEKLSDKQLVDLYKTLNKTLSVLFEASLRNESEIWCG